MGRRDAGNDGDRHDVGTARAADRIDEDEHDRPGGGELEQRRLAEENTSFNDLLADIRAEFAKRYLARRTLSASEVAYLIGFTEPPAFFKAFKRWTGMTPREFQQAAGG